MSRSPYRKFWSVLGSVKTMEKVVSTRKWADGSDWTIEKWNRGEPNNYNGKENRSSSMHTTVCGTIYTDTILRILYINERWKRQPRKIIKLEVALVPLQIYN